MPLWTTILPVLLNADPITVTDPTAATRGRRTAH